MGANPNEFYIGWQAEAPPGYARLVRRFVLALAVVLPLLAGLLVGFQRGFSNGTFEYGKRTELEGTLRTGAVPFLKVQSGRDTDVQNILLVAPGKFGYHPPAGFGDGQPVRVAGFLIYHDGKTALQVEDMTAVPGAADRSLPPLAELATATLRGEVTDPKCLLGVMKPGEGAPHRDCAARCIAGGIPPVLRVANAAGETEYYLLVGPNGEALNDRMSRYAADAVQVRGQLKTDGDWIFLYADTASLRRINRWTLNPGVMCH